jgi:membrane-bound lytic murein transglycosylase B
MIRFSMLRWLCLLVATLPPLVRAAPAPQGALNVPGVRAFIQQMATKHGFDDRDLTRLFGQVRLRPDIIAAISHPAEAKPWYQYRPIFLTRSRVLAGVRFWNRHADALARAERVYGVPASIVVAIIGVETRFGTYSGKYRVMDSLTTLAFDYPKRGPFFRKELEQFLLLTREEHVDPLLVTGSYAGAMGGPQFISSSYRRYAVDFDHDGKRDLWHSYADMIGSVANYFHVHGWAPGQPVARPAQVSGKKYQALVGNDAKPRYTVQQLREHGVRCADSLPNDQKAALIALDGRDGPEYWVGLHNFYVITRYNHSELYAMAVHQLADAIRSQRERLLAGATDPRTASGDSRGDKSH